MDLSAYHYSLPDELIARFPAPNRRDSRLLVLPGNSGEFVHERFAKLAQYLRAGDVLVINDTKVIPARLYGTKDSGGKIELLLERIVSEDSALVHLKASKSPPVGCGLRFADGLSATVTGRDGALYQLQFSAPVLKALQNAGHVPLPPYLGRGDEPDDRERYQTVYAREPGAVAAPTAGLHFDEAMLAAIKAEGIDVATITLHVGAGTFQNLRPEQLESGRLHPEQVQISQASCDTINAAKRRGGRVIAVGTTSTRALECASKSGKLLPFSGETDLFIREGYEFRCVDGLITNFHLPESSLLMLLCAFAGHDYVMRAYNAAIEHSYRFFSYGDAMLCFRQENQESTGAI